jgi:acetoacetate decarboxylase
MGTPGQLTPDKFGYSMPLDSPLYEPFPVYYRDITLLLYAYVTDAKAAAALLPPQLELPDVPVAQMVFATYPFSTVGTYNEVAQTIACTYQGKPMAYAVRLHVTNAMAMAAGREIGGFPKKLGEITFEAGEYYSSTLESPAGFRLASALLDPMAPIPNAVPKTLDFVSLRVFPNPLDPKTPSLAQLIGTSWILSDGEMWEARGSVDLTDVSTAINPYNALPVVEPIPPGSREWKSSTRLPRT